MRIHKPLKLILPLLILALAIGVFAYLRATRPQKPVAVSEERVWRVEVEPARLRHLAPQLVLYGQVENPDLLKVMAAGAGRVAEVAVRDGQRVASGELLVRLDDRDFLPALQQAEAAVAELEALVQSELLRHTRDLTALEQELKLLDLARAGVERAERLKTQRAGSDADLDVAEQAVAQQRLAVNQRERDLSDHPARIAVLEARLASARAKVAEIALDLDRSVVRAPFAGLVAGVEVTTGDQVKADAQLLRLYALADLEVRARIPAPYQAEIGAVLAAGEDLCWPGPTSGAWLPRCPCVWSVWLGRPRPVAPMVCSGSSPGRRPCGWDRWWNCVWSGQPRKDWSPCPRSRFRAASACTGWKRGGCVVCRWRWWGPGCPRPRHGPPRRRPLLPSRVPPETRWPERVRRRTRMPGRALRWTGMPVGARPQPAPQPRGQVRRNGC